MRFEVTLSNNEEMISKLHATGGAGYDLAQPRTDTTARVWAGWRKNHDGGTLSEVHATMTAAVETRKAELQARAKEVETMQVSSKSASQRDYAALTLEKDFKSFKISEATLKNKQGMLDQMQTRVKSLQEQREGLKG